MEPYSQYKYYIASTAVAACCVGFTYYYLKQRYKLREAVEAFDYLNIKIITTETACDEVVSELRRRCTKNKALGFDCEWVTEHGRRHPVALLQLSSADGLCGLFKLSSMKTVPASLKALLEDEKIYKVGVAAGDDGRYLYHDYAVVLKATLDLRHLAALCGYEAGGLATLSRDLLNVVLDKSWRVRGSDWEAEEMTTRQSQYAATDAHVAVKIFDVLVSRYNRRKLVSWLRAEDWDDIDAVCWRHTDVNYKQSCKPRNIAYTESKPYKEPKVSSKRYPHATRSKPLYHNCFLLAPDGELLCTCDNKKALWYVEKELADVVKEEPLTVKLRFEPAGRGVGEVGRYYQLEKENKCVVCGASNSYIRKNVVPREYRKYFPEIMKDHSSHDIVLLCTSCHQLSNIRDQAVRDMLANMCDAPLASREHVRTKEDPECKKVRSAARALLYQARRHALPSARRQELELVLLQHFPEHHLVTEDLLHEAAEMTIVFDNKEYECHGAKVVEQFVRRAGGLLQLERVWRDHFVAAMRPRHLPQLWSLDHNEQRLRVKWNEGRLSEEDLKLIGVCWTKDT